MVINPVPTHGSSPNSSEPSESINGDPAIDPQKYPPSVEGSSIYELSAADIRGKAHTTDVAELASGLGVDFQ